jgi:3-dehydroquinate synthase
MVARMMTDRVNSTQYFFNLIFLYGPPGSGKTSVGRELAKSLALPFIDLDQLIEEQTGKSIQEIFDEQGEDGFRKLEKKALQDVAKLGWGVIALGGGTLLTPENKQLVEQLGVIACLSASESVLVERLETGQVNRPLLVNDGEETPDTGKLRTLLDRRAGHYATFKFQIGTDSKGPDELVLEIETTLGAFHVRGMAARAGTARGKVSGLARPLSTGYDIRISPALDSLGVALRMNGMSGPIVIVTDQNVAEGYLSRIERSLQAEDYPTRAVIIPPGEESKTMVIVSQLWEAFLGAGLERGSSVVALGGGVVGDLAGFAAATYMRGIPWVYVPTSLLAMVDASLGGKTGVDLPQGKNLVGAFHAPRMVLVDPSALETLPWDEQRSGMAEVIKSGLIGDPKLFDLSRDSLEVIKEDFEEIIRRAMAVKIQVIEADPFEEGLRAMLNLGHTVGHAVEQVSNYTIRHGEAVAIGMVAEARLSERIGLAERGLTDEIADACKLIGLPVDVPEILPREDILEVMKVDKKREGAKVKFALPVKIGEVRPGVEVSDIEALLW